MIDYLNYGKKEQWNTPKIKIPKGQGWLEYRLNQTELDYVWSCVNDREVKKNNWSHNLAGNIDSSFKLEDKNNWFFDNTLTPLINFYENSFGNDRIKVPLNMEYDILPTLDEWWVNYQKQYEFNPPHNHDGIYSFVIWLKIPYDFEEQNKDNMANSKMKGAFSFRFIDLFGSTGCSIYELNKGFEGTMLFFPSKLTHEVFPFYTFSGL